MQILHQRHTARQLHVHVHKKETVISTEWGAWHTTFLSKVEKGASAIVE